MAKTSRSCPQKSIGVFSSVERTSVDIGALPLGKQGFNSPRLHFSDYQRFTKKCCKLYNITYNTSATFFDVLHVTDGCDYVFDFRMADDAQPPKRQSPEERMVRDVPNGVLMEPLLGIDEILADIRKRLAVKRQLDCPEFQVDPKSLQERLLKFCGARKWLRKPREELRKAEESRRSAFQKAKKEQLFGVRPRGGKSKDYAYVFRPDTSPNELFALNRALQSNDPGNALSHPEVVGIIARKFSLGAGDAVIRFLAARLEAYL